MCPSSTSEAEEEGGDLFHLFGPGRGHFRVVIDAIDVIRPEVEGLGRDGVEHGPGLLELVLDPLHSQHHLDASLFQRFGHKLGTNATAFGTDRGAKVKPQDDP